ncbi:MAG: FAD-dependent oxidoreductase [Devosia sp.]
MVIERFDVVVMGSGAAGLTAALIAADQGARVLILEKSPLFGGTSAISGGQLWVPNNRYLAPGADSVESAMKYLEAVTLGEVDTMLLEAFVKFAPQMASEIERLTRLRFFVVDRSDYHSEWTGASWGRSLEPLPIDIDGLGDTAAYLRRSTHRPPLTSVEIKGGQGLQLVAERVSKNQVTQGVALVSGLLESCVAKGVTLRVGCRVAGIFGKESGARSVEFAADGASHRVEARSVVIASGGFEWNKQMKAAFLSCVDDGAASPPWNEGDGLRIGLSEGAAVANMTQAWWSAAFRVPGEMYDGKQLVRNIVRELALPGSILVNADGARFANECSSYNALGKAFQVFDPSRNSYINKRAWLVFDQRFKEAYSVATVSASTPAPDWFITGDSSDQLAAKAGINPEGLSQTLQRFNGFVAAGHDFDFGRGEAKHDQYHGDKSMPHANLGEIAVPPFHAVPIFLGNLGTKGGLKTTVDGAVLDMDGDLLPGLFACGNAAASWMGPGYPGAGGSLGPIMTSAFLCGSAAAKVAGGSNLLH